MDWNICLENWYPEPFVTMTFILRILVFVLDTLTKKNIIWVNDEWAAEWLR